jgi:hypothetical protein
VAEAKNMSHPRLKNNSPPEFVRCPVDEAAPLRVLCDHRNPTTEFSEGETDETAAF